MAFHTLENNFKTIASPISLVLDECFDGFQEPNSSYSDEEICLNSRKYWLNYGKYVEFRQF